MSKRDSVTKVYMQNGQIFADAFNYLLYDGQQKIRPEQLKPLDTTSIVLPYGEDNATVPIQKYRDVLKLATAMVDDNAAYLLLGIENQTHIHYAMPVRNMLYDSMIYVNQVSEADKTHRKAKNRGSSNEEFLSGFHKNDKLLPVITLVVYFGSEPWDAPRTIHEMLDCPDESLLAYTPDYKLNLIAPEEITDDEMQKFHSELRALLKYIKYSRNQEKLQKALTEDEMFRKISHMTAETINKLTKSEIKLDNGEEYVDMCKAIEDMRNDAKTEGRAEGEAKGKAEEKYNLVINLLKMGKLSHEDIAVASGLSLDKIEKISQEL